MGSFCPYSLCCTGRALAYNLEASGKTLGWVILPGEAQRLRVGALQPLRHQKGRGGSCWLCSWCGLSCGRLLLQSFRSRWVRSWCNLGRGAKSVTLHCVQKGCILLPGSSKGWTGRCGSREISPHLGSFLVKPLPRFISNWEKGPSVAQSVEDAGSLWKEGV